MTTSLSFDVSLVVPNPGFTDSNGPTSGSQCVVRFQNNIQSIFSRVRLLYGANPLEDIINYNVIVRNLTEWTAGNPSLCIDQGTITDGIGNNTIAYSNNTQFGPLNTRANLIQGSCFQRDSDTAPNFAQGRGLAGIIGAAPAQVLSTPNIPFTDGTTGGSVPTVTVTKRYQVQLALGLMTQEKLIPTKYMASQLAIELTLETVANCVIANMPTTVVTSVGPPVVNSPGYDATWKSVINYCVFNVNLIPEILEFDACKSYLHNPR